MSSGVEATMTSPLQGRPRVVVERRHDGVSMSFLRRNDTASDLCHRLRQGPTGGALRCASYRGFSQGFTAPKDVPLILQYKTPLVGN